MTIYCRIEDILATVIVTTPNQEKLKFKECPIDVTLTTNTNKGNSIYINGDIERGNTHNPNQLVNWTDSEGLPNDIYSLNFLECGKGGSCGAASPNSFGEKYYAVHIVKNGIDIGNKFFPAGFYSASIQSITRSNFGSYTLKVVSNTGAIISRDYSTEPKYSVVCGEECPPGTVKCNSTNYPGYCCLPCDTTKQEIIAIKNIVQSVNKGSTSYG